MHLSNINFWFFDFDKWYVEKKCDLEIQSYLSEKKIESSVEETCKKKLQLQQQTRLKPRNDDRIKVETINF